MTMYSFEIPTTATISFSEFCHDQSDRQDYVSRLPEVTQARANIRATLKEMKATESGGKDYLTLVKLLEEYLPQIQGIGFKSEPIFSWKSTLSSNILKSSRISLPGLHADYAFTLLIYGYALSNLAWSMVEGLGAYEQDRAISDELRKHKDKELNVAVDHLCKASGIFAYIADTVLPAWDVNRTDGPPGFNRPPELIREVNTALSKMVLADAQTLAIRRLQSKSAYESNIAPGPPLPLSHPSPSLLAKLHLECASLYASMKPHSITRLRINGFGVFAGEKGGSEKGGEAVAFLIWAKKELEELKDSGKIALGKGEKEKHDRRKAKLSDEITSTSLFLKQYKQMNDSVHFQPVPPQSELQRVIPAGTLARKTTPYTPPQPCFGPNSIEYLRRKTEELKAKDDTKDGAGPPGPPPKESPHVGKYSGAGAYF
ncbi:pH-response regulator protein palC [Ephemerocybe angulata]|uniref:pH-response regulator protein palC n=1 Tax=Ephemerocybe angulata TaxID=980116 RepID=A0A8H6ICQ5_9AGAR|nr:pH-response regulator protein palC [Tulosesus angulatus]